GTSVLAAKVEVFIGANVRHAHQHFLEGATRRLREDFAKELPVLGLRTAAVAGGQALEGSDQLRIHVSYNQICGHWQLLEGVHLPIMSCKCNHCNHYGRVEPRCIVMWLSATAGPHLESHGRQGAVIG